ncbi:MAG: PAS domain S-box protein [Candidatus Heimdallarchaeota archaeon]
MTKELNINFDDLSHLLENIPVAIFELEYSYSSKMGKFNYLNNVAKELFGMILPKEKLDSEFNILELLMNPEMTVDNIQILERITKNGSLVVNNQQFLLKRKDGNPMLVNSSIKADIDGDTIFIRGIFQESLKVVDSESTQSSEYKTIEKEVETFREFFDTFDALIMIVNEEGRILFVSPNVDNRFLYKPKAEIIGIKFDEIFPKGQADFFLSHCIEAIEKNTIVTMEYHLPIENMVRWFQSQAIPVQVTNGETKKVVTIIRDITNLKTKPI